METEKPKITSVEIDGKLITVEQTSGETRIRMEKAPDKGITIEEMDRIYQSACLHSAARARREAAGSNWEIERKKPIGEAEVVVGVMAIAGLLVLAIAMFLNSI